MDLQHIFSETESDFYQYLTTYGGVNKHSRTNYMSWLKFLSQYYKIDGSITDDYINHIIDHERTQLANRAIYTSEKDLVNFKSALRKYRTFAQSDFRKMQEDSIIAEIRRVEQSTQIQQTEKTAIIKSRVGQGLFREHLIEYWGGCSISGCQFSDILIASHIKPWKVADNQERLDTFNGLLLLPNYDKLFDKGYISFDTNGKIIISNFLPTTDRKLLHIEPTMHLISVEERHKPFLQFHNQNCLIQ